MSNQNDQNQSDNQLTNLTPQQGQRQRWQPTDFATVDGVRYPKFPVDPRKAAAMQEPARDGQVALGMDVATDIERESDDVTAAGAVVEVQR